MKNRNVEDLLKKISPPDVILPSAKEKLRRELLTSDQFKRRPTGFWQQMLGYAVKGVPVIVIVLVFILVQIPGKISATERLEKLEATYKGSIVENSIHYIKTRFENTWKPGEILIFEQWRYGMESLRMLLTLEKTGDILSHLIYKKNKAFLYTDKKSEAKINVDATEDDTPTGANGQVVKDSEAYSIICAPVKNQPGDDKNKKKLNATISHDSLDIFGFTAQEPGNIFARLKSSPSITYAGTEADRLEVFERKTAPGIMSYIIEYEKGAEQELDALLQELRFGKIRFPEGSGTVFIRDKTKKNGNHGFKIEKVEVKEITRVNKFSGKIHSISRQSFYRGQPVVTHELIFLEEFFIDYDPMVFDENVFGLESHKIDITPAPSNGKKQGREIQNQIRN